MRQKTEILLAAAGGGLLLLGLACWLFVKGTSEFLSTIGANWLWIVIGGAIGWAAHWIYASSSTNRGFFSE